MNEWNLRFRVGAVVVTSLIITGILVALFGDLTDFFRNRYPVRVRFDNVSGVGEATPVRRSGKLIGEVTSVDFDDEGRVIVATAIDDDIKLRHNDVCRISQSLLGDSVLEFVRADDPQLSTELIKPDELIDGIDAVDPMQAVSSLLDLAHDLRPQVREMMASVTTTSNELGSLSSQLNDLISKDEGKLAKLVEKMDVTLTSVGALADNANAVIGNQDVQAGLKQSAAELPQLLLESRQAIAGLKSTLASADRNLNNLEGFTRPLGQRGTQLFDKLDRSADDVGILLEELTLFSRSLNRSEGTLGQLVHDPELYNNINAAARNIEVLTRELRPILYDIRVITDKVSRDPGRLGVRGIFQQGSGIK